MISWTDYNGTPWNYLAARVKGNGCDGCIFVQASQHAGSSTWYQVPRSGWSDGFVGEISMVAAGGYLYFIGSTNTTPYTASYITTNVMYGFSDTGWSSWTPIPGNGAFQYPASATAFQGNGGFFVVGVGTDGQAYAQAYNSAGWNNYWWVVSGGDTFIASIWATTFSRFGNDLEVFGLAPGDIQAEGDLGYTDPNGFNGWSSYGNSLFFRPFTATSPGASAPVAGHVDLAVNGGSRIYFSEYNN